MGSRIIKMDPAQGFSAQASGAAVILAASHFGFPLSTTHVISGGGHGRRRGQAPVRGALGRGRQHRRRLGPHAARGRRDRRHRLCVQSAFGSGAAGPLVVSVAMVGAIAAVFVRRLAQDRLAPAEA